MDELPQKLFHGKLKRSAQYGIVVLLPLVVLLGNAWISSGNLRWVNRYLSGQRIFVDPYDINLGEVRADEVLKLEFEIVNRSSNAVLMTGTRQSCSCIGLKGFPMTIPSNESASIPIVLLVPSRVGPFRQTIELFSNHPKTPAIRILVSATIISPEEELPID
jgi:hypothetical protein